MKTFLIPALIAMLAWSCKPAQQIAKSTSHKIVSDSSGYEITIIDPAFDNWYLMHFSPAKDYSNEYYRSKNQFGVNNWNDCFMHGRYHHAIDSYINYESSVDYGIEVNRKLYWYFKYTEEKFRIRLLR